MSLSSLEWLMKTSCVIGGHRLLGPGALPFYEANDALSILELPRLASDDWYGECYNVDLQAALRLMKLPARESPC